MPQNMLKSFKKQLALVTLGPLTPAPAVPAFWINTRDFTATVKLLDTTVYVGDGGNEQQHSEAASRLIPVRGCLVLNVKKRSLKLRRILLKLNGIVQTNLVLKDGHLAGNSVSKNTTIAEQEREWNYEDGQDNLIRGSYNFSFQFVLDGTFPESLRHQICSVFYSVVAVVETENGKKLSCGSVLEVVRCSSAKELVRVDDSIAIGNWRDLVFYQMTLENKLMTLGRNFDLSWKLLPINASKYKAHALNVHLYQTTEYKVDADERKYKTEFTNSEKIPLVAKKITPKMLSEDESLLSSLSVMLHKMYTRSDSSIVKVYPTTIFSDKSPSLQITHKLRVGVVLEELAGGYRDERSKSIGSVTSAETLSVSEHKFPKTGEPILSSNDQWITSNAKVIYEPERKINKKIELAMSVDVVLLKDESCVGNSPPPIYQVQCDASSVFDGNTFFNGTAKMALLPPSYNVPPPYGI